MTDQYEFKDVEFGDIGQYITGVAVVDFDGAPYYDRDIGGSDGVEYSRAEISSFRIGSLTLSRDQVVAVATEAHVKQWEESALEQANDRSITL